MFFLLLHPFVDSLKRPLLLLCNLSLYLSLPGHLTSWRWQLLDGWSACIVPRIERFVDTFWASGEEHKHSTPEAGIC